VSYPNNLRSIIAGREINEATYSVRNLSIGLKATKFAGTLVEQSRYGMGAFEEGYVIPRYGIVVNSFMITGWRTQLWRSWRTLGSSFKGRWRISRRRYDN
jgi:hypothetical protein